MTFLYMISSGYLYCPVHHHDQKCEGNDGDGENGQLRCNSDLIIVHRS